MTIVRWPRLCKPTAYKLPEINRVEVAILLLYITGSLCFLAGSLLALMEKLL